MKASILSQLLAVTENKYFYIPKPDSKREVVIKKTKENFIVSVYHNKRIVNNYCYTLTGKILIEGVEYTANQVKAKEKITLNAYNNVFKPAYREMVSKHTVDIAKHFADKKKYAQMQ